MLNIVWLGLLVASVAVGVWTGRIPQVVASVTESAESAAKLAFGFVGIMALWLGMMKIAEESGLVTRFTHLVQPFIRLLFPGVPADHPALGSMTMNLVANAFGLNNAATPLGLKAMKDLDGLNDRKGTATDEMCMFLAFNTSSVQLIPAGAIAILAAGGASDPTVVVLPALMATSVSTFVGIVSARLLSRSRRFEMPAGKDDGDERTG